MKFFKNFTNTTSKCLVFLILIVIASKAHCEVDIKIEKEIKCMKQLQNMQDEARLKAPSEVMSTITMSLDQESESTDYNEADDIITLPAPPTGGKKQVFIYNEAKRYKCELPSQRPSSKKFYKFAFSPQGIFPAHVYLTRINTDDGFPSSFFDNSSFSGSLAAALIVGISAVERIPTRGIGDHPVAKVNVPEGPELKETAVDVQCKIDVDGSEKATIRNLVLNKIALVEKMEEKFCQNVNKAYRPEKSDKEKDLWGIRMRDWKKFKDSASASCAFLENEVKEKSIKSLDKTISCTADKASIENGKDNIDKDRFNGRRNVE